MKPSDYIKKGWCQQSNARDIKGNKTWPACDDAVCWCIYGALSKALPTARFVEATRQVRAKIANITEWNDAPERTQQEVIDLLISLDL